MVKAGQLVAHSLALHLTTDIGDAERAERLHQQHAQPVAHLRQGQRRCQLLPPMGFTDEEPYRDQRQRQVGMPAFGAADKAARLMR